MIKNTIPYHCSLITNLLLSLSSFACLALNGGSILQNRSWSAFFVLLGLSSFLSGVGHSLNDAYHWLIISRLVMLLGMFMAINAGLELYGFNRIALTKTLNLLVHVLLAGLLLIDNNFIWVNASIAGTFGLFIPIGLKKSQVSKFISGPMYTGIILLVLGGLIFARYPRATGDEGMHIAHIIVSAGTCLIGWSLSKHIAFVNSKDGKD